MALQELTFETVSSIIPYDVSAFEPSNVGVSSITKSAERAEKKHINVPNPETFLKERFENVEDVLDSYTSYMKQINSHVEKKMHERKGNPDMAKNSASAKGLGCNNFIESLKKSVPLDSEMYAESRDLIEIATMGLILLDLNAFNVNYSNLDKVAALDKFVSIGVLNPKYADLALKVTSDACPSCAEYRTVFSMFEEGVKAEVFTIYSVLSSKKLIEEDLEVVKTNPAQDVFEGIDIGIRKKGKKDFIALYDIKKAINSSASGVCFITNIGGTVYAYEAESYIPSLVETYGVEQNVIDTAKRRKLPFVIVRVPQNFNFPSGLFGMENFDEEEYTAFHDRVVTETNFQIDKRKGEHK